MSDRQHSQDRDRNAGAGGDTRHAAARPELSAPFASLLWPFAAAASVGQATAAVFDAMTTALSGKDDDGPPPDWATPSTVRLALPSMLLRDFSRDAASGDSTSFDNAEPATLVCAPFALHRATVADFAARHSVIETLLDAGLPRLFATDWRSATAEMRHFSIDTYLADLNVAVDDLKAPVNLVGLCQGGWLALVYAARFPEKVNRLAIAGAPVDIAAASSGLSRFVAGTPLAWFEHMVRAGDGLVSGRHLLKAWSVLPTAADIEQVLQIPPATDQQRRIELERQFRRWNVAAVDLPGTFYLQVVHALYKENRIARNRFTALGREIDLRRVTMPTCLLAGRDDEVVAPEQVLATRRLIGTPPADIVTIVEPCRHLSLFMGAATLASAWRRIGRWLTPEADVSRKRVA